MISIAQSCIRLHVIIHVSCSMGLDVPIFSKPDPIMQCINVPIPVPKNLNANLYVHICISLQADDI